MQGSVFNIYGVVQGVGFRPFVHRIACKYHIAGQVINKGSYVEVIAQGAETDLQKFKTALKEDAPERASIKSIEEFPYTGADFDTFSIEVSERDSGVIFIPPDIATCRDCRQELYDPDNRRYLHSFINCTACGPRLTILESLPYDRERTSMKKFPMCPECSAEYNRITSRRYDAQPVCCNDCGPQLYILNSTYRNGEAIRRVREVIMQGKIVAIKGIGGFHLACDGRNPAAAARLRELKHRPVKPFAVMMRDLETVRRECELTPEAEAWLDGCEKPILLLDKRADSTLPEVLAPFNPTLGVMLPYAPLQMLLFDYPDQTNMTDVLVMTSGNVAGAPICRSEEDAIQEIGSFCDCILSHDRDIRLRADDSVMALFENAPCMIRRSRGFAPLPITLAQSAGEGVLAVGGELKNAFCIARGNMAYLAPHIGDMEDVRSQAALRESIALFSRMLESKVQLVVCDMHPGYHTSAMAGELDLPLVKVQHHYAHILSCMAENNWFDKVIGVAMDGTGYGLDGTIWGGEILLADTRTFDRVGFIAPFPLPGGDTAAREGWRAATGIFLRYMPDRAAEYTRQLELCSEAEFKLVSAMVKNRINTVECTSAGRLFDAVSALLNIARKSTFEGDAAIRLQFAAEAYEKAHRSDVYCSQLDWSNSNGECMPADRLFVYLAEKFIQEKDANACAYIFHRELAELIVRRCQAVRAQSGVNTCALSGGSFQNRLLLKLCVELLRKNNFNVLTHKMVPANDGGISLGQALYGINYSYKE